jgi:23S rRNA pseudouridine2604 synthase
MSEPVTLTRRVAQLCACSYDEAEKIIADGGVSIDGVVATDAQHLLRDERIEIDPATRPEAIEPATILLHKPAGMATADAAALFAPSTRWADDPSSTRMLPRHYKNLSVLMPLEPEASGLIVLSQDGRAWRRLTEDADEIEQEFVVDVRGQPGPYALGQLARGLSYNGRPLPSCKVSWQSEQRLRFAIHNVQPGQLRHMCTEVGLELIAMRRLRIGRIPLTKLPPGEWRVLPAGEKF